MLARITAIVALSLFFATGFSRAATPDFHHDIRPILENYCFDCHADGANKGNVAFDQFADDQAVLTNRDLWFRVLKNVRAGLMPPATKARPTDAEKALLAGWIKYSVFAIDPQNPDPGRVTLRRLNRAEYRNTIRDLMGVDFDTDLAFPPDDTGHGFDDIGDVLTLPPMLLEKYVLAANQIVTEAVPMQPRIVAERTIVGTEFHGGGYPHSSGDLALSFYHPSAVSNVFNAAFPGKYQLKVSLMVKERFVDNVFDYNKCRLIFRIDGRELHRDDYSWEGGKRYHYEYPQTWDAGPHLFSFELQPLTTNDPARSLTLQISEVDVTGPLEKEHWVQPANYAKFFPKPVPPGSRARRAYVRELLSDFAGRAFRRPPPDRTVDRLVDLAETVSKEPGKTFEAGVAAGMQAVLSSPRFLFLQEKPEPPTDGAKYPLIDEYSLASRLSYFLWSSMPDDELMRLAAAGKLRANLPAQVERMLRDPRSAAFVADFTGQWLRGRDIENVPIEAKSVLEREGRELADDYHNDLTGDLRYAMRMETERTFGYVLHHDRSVLELIDSDYTFLNERLAGFYGIPDVHGDQMRLVQLPAGCPRGGVLTEGTVLAATSNPTRTSPVKRGLFILDNILGIPPPPPPANVPPLEKAAAGIHGHDPSLREALAAHRRDPLCSSCHSRLDPPGLALENFNAMGEWRDQELGQPIDASGKLITGETFTNASDLKRILVKNHWQDFYRTLTEKMLIYALGRGLDYYDVETTDQIAARLERAGGKPSALIAGIVESAPFQRTRLPEQTAQDTTAKPQLDADARRIP